MSVKTRIASDPDLPFLCDVDTQVSDQVQAELVSQGRVMVAEVDGVVVGCLRWGLFWDEVPFMNLLWIIPERRGHGVGTTMIEAWEEFQFTAGHTMVLTSTVSAERAQHLYRPSRVRRQRRTVPSRRAGGDHPAQATCEVTALAAVRPA